MQIPKAAMPQVMKAIQQAAAPAAKHEAPVAKAAVHNAAAKPPGVGHKLDRHG